MKREIVGLIVIVLIIVGIFSSNINSATVAETNSTRESNKTLIIDLDKEREEQESRGEVEKIIYGILRTGDNNDEVTFIGKMLAYASDIVITIRDSSDKLKDTIKNTLTIKTDKLENGDIIILKKGNKVLMEKEVEKKE